jgi:hypothetical protein
MWYKEFLDGDPYDYFVCMDDDVSFDPVGFDVLIDRIVDSGFRFVTVPYSFKAPIGHPKHLKTVCVFFEGNHVVDRNGFVDGKWGNGGFIVASKNLLLSMIDIYQDLYVEWDPEKEGDPNMHRESWALWCPYVRDRVLLSEDYAFSQRAADCGFSIHIYTKLPTIHWDGSTKYEIDLTGANVI